MKKIKFFGIAALLALGFGFMSCDEGVASDEFEAQTKEGGYASELPTTYANLGGDESAASVTAKWDFTTAATYGLITASETTIAAGKEIEPSSGEGAYLYTVNFTGKIGTTDNAKYYLQSKKSSSSSLSSLSDAPSLALILEDDSNVVITAKGAGAAESARFIAVYAADDDFKATGDAIIYKNNLDKGKDVTFQLANATAGNYLIYVNGSSIYSIDTIATTSKPAQISALKITTAQSDIADFEVYETLTLNVVDTADENTSLNADAIWTSSNESVATVKAGVVTGVAAGTAIIRARIGRFYDQRTVKVTASTKTRATFLTADSMPSTETKWADATAAVKEAVLKPTVIGGIADVSDATLTISDSVTAWSDEPTLAAKGSSTNSYKFGFYWKDNESANVAADKTVATLKFTVTPKSGTVKLHTLAAQSYNGKGTGGAKIKLTAGSGSGTISSTKADSVDSVDLGDIEISEATEVTVEIQIASGKKCVSCGVQDLALAITN